MAKVRFKANKLENATVRYISLVSRGANRIPFRIVKLDKEKDMIDLASMFKRVQKAEETQLSDDATGGDKSTEPTVVALVVEKSDQKIEEILKTGEFKLDDKVENEDKTVLYKQADFDPEKTVVFKLGDGLLALVANFDDGTTPESVKKFHESRGFYPEVDHVASVAKAEGDLSDITAYSDILEATIPSAVFKAAAAIDALEPVETEVVKADTSDEAEGDDEESDDEDNEGFEALMTLVKKSVEEQLGEKLSEITKTLEKLTSQVSGIADQSKSLETKVAEVEVVAKAADERVKGTIIGGAPSVDREVPVKKAANTDPRSGVFDTALLPRRANRVIRG